MGDIDFATIFTQTANEAELQKIINTYRDKIDEKALSAIAKAAFETIVEQKPVEDVNARLMADIKEYIIPRGKLSLPEYYSLIESFGKIFLKYQQKKNETISNSKQNGKTGSVVKYCPICGEPIDEQFDKCWKCAKNDLSNEEADLITSKVYETDSMKVDIFGDDGDIIVYDFDDYYFGINPSEEEVKQPDRSQKRYPLDGIKISIKSILIAIIVLIVGIIARRLFYEAGPAPRVVISGIVIAVLFGCLVSFFQGFKIAFTKPNQKTPEDCLKEFFVSIQYSLYGRAYSLLTDQGQQVSANDFPRKNNFSKMMPSLSFNDLYSFTKFWSKSDFIHFNEESISVLYNNNDTALLSAILKAKDTKNNQESQYENRFLIVKRMDNWFLTNGYIWPL